MKNVAEFKNVRTMAKMLLDVFSTLDGNGKSFDPMLEGIHNVVVVKSEERLSAKGKEMKEIQMRSLSDGRDVTIYVMKFRTYDWNKWKDINVGQNLVINLTFNNGFASVDIVTHKDIIDIPKKPSVALSKQTIMIYDVEIFKKDDLYVFKDYFTKEVYVINNNLESLRKFYLEYRDSLFIGYNNISYDNNIFRSQLQGKNPYHVSKAVIESDDRALTYKMFDTKKTPLFSMDLYQDNRGFSLKEHAAFLGLNIMETQVDFDLDRELTDDEKVLNIAYCKNDVDATELRFEQNLPMLLAKVVLAAKFGLDKLSLSMTNANLTATILGAIKSEDRDDERDCYELPDGFLIENQEVLDNMTGELPEKIAFSVERRDVRVDLGEGGSHSAKPSFINVTEPMYHNDATSLHPSSIELFNLASRNIPEEYKGRYTQIIKDRVEAKHNKNKMITINGVAVFGWVLDMGYKLPLNTKYGAMGAKFNKLYDARNRLLVCLVGQLAFFDLLEKLEPHAKIIQTNTDAIDMIPNSDKDYEASQEIMRDWEKRTGYNMESEKYVEMFQKDVNNYVQRMDNDEVNIVGAIGLTRGLKNSKAIVSNAFINYLLAEKDYKEFIYECDELRQYQIISKTGWTFDETVMIDKNGDELPAQKVNRVFAVREDYDNVVELFKTKVTKWSCEEQVIDSFSDDYDTDNYDLKVKDALEQYNEFKDDSGIYQFKAYTKGLNSAPTQYTISNEQVGQGISIDDVDKEYYIKQVEDTLEMWLGESWLERINQVKKDRASVGRKPLEVKNYID
ncbi:MAG: hypothetical protein RR929_00215 [Erysipelotrichaceae bacterium]